MSHGGCCTVMCEYCVLVTCDVVWFAVLCCDVMCLSAICFDVLGCAVLCCDARCLVCDVV